MRATANTSTIGVSCGHVVPRVKLAGRERLPGYWCEPCGAYRMSGSKSTGEISTAWVLLLGELVDENPLPVVVADPGTDHGRALTLALGAQIRSAA